MGPLRDNRLVSSFLKNRETFYLKLKRQPHAAARERPVDHQSRSKFLLRGSRVYENHSLIVKTFFYWKRNTFKLRVGLNDLSQAKSAAQETGSKAVLKLRRSIILMAGIPKRVVKRDDGCCAGD